MRTHLHLLLFYLCTVSISGVKESEEERYRKKIIDQLIKTRTVLLEDYHLVTRQIATDVYKYKDYQSVSVVTYPITRDVTDAHFTFLAEELHMNSIGSCKARDVIVNLKHGSYPAVNPDGYKFPKDFADPFSSVYTLELKSDGVNASFSLSNPTPGNWYALVYIKWEDPRTEKVKQEGLVPNCHTILYSDLQVKRDDQIEIIDCYKEFTIAYDEIPKYFKCITTESILPITLNVNVVDVPANHSEVSFKVRGHSLPTDDTYLLRCAFDPVNDGSQSITFEPLSNSWHYIATDLIENRKVSEYADCESYLRTENEIAGHATNNQTILDLMRDDKGRFFNFDYGLPTTDIKDSVSLLNLTSSEIITTRFKIQQFLDIGGNLAIEASLLMHFKYYMGYRRPATNGTLLAFTDDNQYLMVVVCLNIGHASVPTEDGRCRFNDLVKPALFVLNSTDSETISSKVIIPYPESGTWYLSFRLFCDNTVCPCPTSDNGTRYYVSTEKSRRKSEFESISSNETREGVSDCKSTVLLSISSSPCVAGRCSDNGVCLLNTFGGLIMSFCSCTGGYGGWDCSDASRVDSEAYMLLSMLFLTLSNILFLFSIYVAVIRQYYTEALMYTFTMVFSTFYHACDAPPQIAFCIIKNDILKFGDFYCGLMSFWVTLLAMSILNEQMLSFFRLLGANMIALLTTWNMHSAVSFILPVVIGVVVLMATWGWDYYLNRKMKYQKSYYKWYLPIGIVLVTVGLICYTLLQTEQNYKVVHSIWHMIIAVSVVFLLPEVRVGANINPFVASRRVRKFSFRRLFKRSRPPTNVDQ